MSEVNIVVGQTHRPFNYDGIKRVFVKMDCYGGYGLAPADKPDPYHAIPERKPGKKVTTNLGEGVEVHTHNCEYRFWYTEGILVDGIFYQRI